VKEYNAAVRRQVDRSSDAKTAEFFRIVFPGHGKIILKVGPGNQTTQEWELNKDQLRCLVLDSLPELLR
jgi:hypothetical protein